MKNSKYHFFTRFLGFALAGILVLSLVMPSMVPLLAEESDPLLRIYEMLSGTVEDPETGEDYYELANIAIGQKRYDDALSFLESAREMTDAQDGVLLGDMWLKTASVQALQGKYDEALVSLESALANDAQCSQAYLLRAQIVLEQGDYEAATADMETYVEQTEDDNARLTLAQLYEAVGRFADAEATYTALYEAQDDDAHLLNAIRCGFLNGEYEQTAVAAQAYLDENPDADAEHRAVAAFLSAACQMQQGDYSAAMAGFTTAMEEGYDAATCYEQLVLCSFEAQDFAATIEYGETMLAEELVPTTPDVFYQRMGAALMQVERYEDAVTMLDQSIELNPDLLGSFYYRGVSQLALQAYEEAVFDFTASIEQNFLDQYCYYNRGVCYVQLLDYDSALNDFAKTLEVADDEGIVQAAKDILWQLAAYFETQAALTQTPAPMAADANEASEAIDGTDGTEEATETQPPAAESTPAA